MKKSHISNSLLAAAILSGFTFPAFLNAADYSSFTENDAAQKQISNLSMYQLIASQENIANYGSTAVGSTGWYNYANTASIRNGFSGAIWYMQTENSNGNTEWALIDAPNYSGTSANDFYKLGLPRSGNASDVVNMAVTGTNFYTSYDTALMPLFNGVTADADGVKSIQNSILLIESWPFNYNSGTKASVLDQNGNTVTLNGASGGDYDWNDTPNKDGDHGSFQLHIYDAANSTGQTIIGMGRLYRPKETFCVGIGNSNSGNSKDWTMAEPTSKAGSRVFQVLALPNYKDTDRIFNAESADSNWTSADAWLGAGGNTASTPTVDNDIFINYGNLIISTAAAANMMDISALGSVTVTADGNLSVPGVKYKDGTETNPRLCGNFTSYGTLFVQDHWMISDNASLNILGGTFSTNGTVHLADAAGHSVTANIENANITKASFAVGHLGSAEMTVRNSALNGGLTVGNSGSGTLLFHNSTQNGDVNIANNQNSSGKMTITGADSKITSNTFNVGYRGNGQLEIHDGTIVANSYFCVGNNVTAAVGSVVQYGGLVQSTWFPLGHHGSGTYDLYGGKLHATGGGDAKGLAIGDQADGRFTFNAHGGEIQTNEYLIVGRQGQGTLNISGDAKINCGGYFSVGYIKGSNGTVNMESGTISTKQLGLGDRGTGTFNLYDGSITTHQWLLAGFTEGTGTFNQFGGTVNPAWFVLGWDPKSTGNYNMYGGTFTANGNGNPAIVGRYGKAVFNLYDGDMTLKTAVSSNQTGNESQFIGYSLKIGGYNGTASQMNIYAGDIKAAGKVSMSAQSALNFTTSVKGLGTLAIEGAFEQNGGAVTVSHADGLSFTDNYSLQNGKDIMTVGGKSALTVTNNSSNILTTSYSQDTGALNVKFNDSLYLGSMNGISDSLTFDPTTAGWVSLDYFGGSDPYNFTMTVDTNDLGIENFVNALNDQINPQDDLWLTVEALDDTHVSMTFMPDLADIDTISWDFTNTDIYGALGVSVSGLSMGQVPEPASWTLLLVGLGLFGAVRVRKARVKK